MDEAAEGAKIVFLIFLFIGLAIQFFVCIWCFSSTWKYANDVTYISGAMEPSVAPEVDTEKGNQTP